MRKTALGGLFAVIFAVCASGASASVIMETFAFKKANNTVVAQGSFSFDSSKTGVIGYSDLSAFSITLANTTYDLAFINSLSAPLDYIYFGYDVGANLFVPAAVSGYANLDPPACCDVYSGIMAGVSTKPNVGFFIDPLVGSADPAHTGADGAVANYAYNYVTPPTAASYSITPAASAAVPEPSTWLTMLGGVFGLGCVLRRARPSMIKA